MRDTFGRYLGNFVSDFQTAFGYPVNYLSMQNEPDINVSYDSCVYTAAEYAATAPYVNTYVPASVFLLSPETSAFDNTYYQTVLSAAGAEFDFGCMHSYGSAGGAIAAANRAQKPIWQTEFSILSDTDGGAVDAASLIKNFAEDTNDGDASVWFWWQLAGSQLNENDAEQLIIHNGAWDPWTPYTSFTLVKKWYVFRDMTVNIQAGAVNRNTISSAAYLKGAAFRNPTGKFVVVLSSGAKTSLPLTLTIDELAGSGNVAFTQYRTDNSANSAASTVTVSNGVLNSSVPTKTSLILVQN
jgi:glucuronoarabinoxylan endo-1,4-beta-xylanase